jgi:two-component system response regulator NreC
VIKDSQPPRTRVLVADDHAVVRRALRLLLDAQDDLEVVGEAWDIAGTVEAGLTLHPDVAVCDLMMPGGTMLADIHNLVEAGCGVVVLTMEDDPAFARVAMREGASAFMLKDVAADDLVAAVRAAKPMVPAA